MTEKELFTGMCIGGPMQGKEGQSRFPKGFVLTDKPNSRAWVYDRDEASGNFFAREQDTLDLDRALVAAEGNTYDVRALDQ